MVQAIGSRQAGLYPNAGEDPHALRAAQFGILGKRLAAMVPAQRDATLQSIEQRSATLGQELRAFLALDPAGREQMLQRMAQGLPALTDEQAPPPPEGNAALRAIGLQMIASAREQDATALLAMLERTHGQTQSFWEGAATAPADPFAALAGDRAPADEAMPAAANAWWSATASSAYASNLTPKDAFRSGL